MGSGTSSLTTEQKGSIVKDLNVLYEQCQADGLDDEIVKDTIVQEYNKLANSFNSSPSSKSKPERLNREGSSVNRLGVGKAPLGSKEPKPKLMRRRSFDNARSTKIKPNVNSDEKPKEPSTAVASPPIPLASSASESTLRTTENTAMDSWDSVSQQPFCDVCQMAFKSVAFLERHVKYSDLHLKNVEKKDGTNSSLTAASMSIKEEPTPVAPEPPKQDIMESVSTKLAEPQLEGKHFKLVYSGSKLFWRTQRSVDIDIYLHVLPHVLEVISFDSVKHKEMSRIYLNHYIIQDTLEYLVSAEYEEQLKELRLQDRFYDPHPEMKEKLFLQKVTTYVIQRLQLDTTHSTTGEVSYVKLFGDNEMADPLLPEPPAALVPLNLNRRRRTSSQEVEATINSLKYEHSKISEATDLAHALSKSPNKVGRNSFLQTSAAAERLSSLVWSAVRYMSGKRWYHEASLPRKRFVCAARRVIRASLVQQTKKILLSKNISWGPVVAINAGSPSIKYVAGSRKMSTVGRVKEI